MRWLVAGLVACRVAAGSFAETRLEMARRATRLAYNKVGKAGSSELTNVILRVRAARGLPPPPRAGPFHPDAAALAAKLAAVPAGGVWMNHAGHARTADDFAWINLVREPVDRAQSLFYYFVDPVSRKRQKALASERARLNDTACGCGGAEFDACVLLREANGCPLGCSTQQHEAFCAPGARNCSIADAVRALDDDYVFVGLTEEYDLSVAVLERLLPQFFAGASAVLHDGHAVPKVTSARNPATGTRGAGAVSKEARKILMNTTSCRAEARFYAAAKRRFWLVAAAVFGDELLDVARRR